MKLAANAATCMQFQVPQFIEVEDKIFGPLSFRQFVYLAGAGGFFVALYTLLPLYLALLFGAPMVLLALALAFYPVNNRPFIYTLEAAFGYLLAHKLYLWKHEQKALPQKVSPTSLQKPIIAVPRLSQNKLKDIAWSLDIQESMHSRRDQQK